MTAVLTKKTPVRIGVVTNPNSKRNRRRGRAAPRVEELQAIVGEHGVVFETDSTDAISRAVGALMDRGVRYLVSDGGDGALQWLMNEVLRRCDGDLDSAPQIVPTCGGTMNFVARKVGIRGRTDEILEALVCAERAGRAFETVSIPTLQIRGVRTDGTTYDRLGFCAALGGAGSHFFDRYYAADPPGAWTVVKVFTLGLLSVICNAPGLRRLAPARWRAYAESLLRAQAGTVTLNGEKLPGKLWRALAAGAFAINLGGVVRLFPLAKDGRLHVITGNPTMLQIALCVPRLLLGTRMAGGVQDEAAARLEIEASLEDPLRPVADGELFPPSVRLDIQPGPSFPVPRVSPEQL